MSGSVLLGSLSSGHGCWPPTVSVQGSANVFVNGRPVHCTTHLWAVHCCLSDCHVPVAGPGSPNVFANGLSRSRIGDQTSCGDTMVTGSSDVFIN